jgi:rhodanese-related sulfurtransferase
MKTLTTRELHQHLESGPVAVFDVRGDIKYEKGHIPGAKTAPLGSLVFRVASIMNPDSFVVVYSNGGDCTLASQAVERLENLRMKNVHGYEGGIEAWTAAGFDVVESPSPRLVTQGPVVECRSVIVDKDRAYGGVFKHTSDAVEGAGG